MDQEQFHRLLTAGLQFNASDVHLKPGDAPTFRVNGQLAPLKGEKLSADDTQTIAQLIVQNHPRGAELFRLWEFDTSYSIAGVARFRVNIYRQRGSFAIVMRVIKGDVPTVEGLGLPEVIKTIADYERGLVLVTGATGAGKTSTLAAMIQQINLTRRVHILTLEDPIEFLYTNVRASISQREIGMDTENFRQGLRAALRQDPDVILVGEMRDPESIDIALKAAETGHLVFATVHTTDTAKTIGRVVGVFPADEQHMVRMRLADNLKAIVSQRLLPRADSKGRVPACEILINTGGVQDMIRDPTKGAVVKDLIEKGRAHYGMQSFEQHLKDLYRANIITLKTAVEAASNQADFQRALQFE